MIEGKYRDFLSIILIIIIVIIFVLLSLLGYSVFKKYNINKDAKDFTENFEEQAANNLKNNLISNDIYQNTIIEENENLNNEIVFNVIDANTLVTNNTTNPTTNPNSSSTSTTQKSSSQKLYKGYPMIGTIEIPKTNAKYPILENLTNKTLELAVAKQYGCNVNETGNIVIAGHNYRNGLFFSNNYKLEVGDKIYLTDLTGKKVMYLIYNKFETTPEDASFYKRETAGKKEITLTTCTDDSKGRIIIFAKET